MMKLNKKNGNWWQGEIVLGYNLRTLLLLVGALLALAAAGLALWGLWYLLGFMWSGLCWLFSFLWGLKWWLLGAALLAALIWALSRIKWPKRQPRQHKEWKAPKWLLGALLILLLCFLCFRNCSGKEEAVEPAPATPEVVYQQAWDDVVVLRAYLDGVQDSLTNGRKFVGIKNIGLRPVGDAKVAGTTYEASEAIVAEDWKSLIFQHVKKPEALNRAEMAATILAAMRNGRYGFPKSQFLADLNADDKAKALEDIIVLYKANGERRTNGREATQYMWVVQKVFAGEFTAEMALDLPMFSYKTLNIETANTADLLNAKSSWRTPRQALGL